MIMNSAPHLKWLQFFKDVVITVTLWAFETIGFVILFAPFYCLAWIFSRDVARSFQRLNSGFYRWFFALVRALVPACRWQIDDAVKAIRGSVVVANHISYLDPILLFSSFPASYDNCQTTSVSYPHFWLDAAAFRLSAVIVGSVAG